MKFVVSERDAAVLRDIGFADLQAELADYRENILPKRMQDAVDQVNAKLGKLLPDGMRFEWSAPPGIAPRNSTPVQ
jgi:hypothetical protein